ncbi:hypothetical protein EMCRGX_G027192 [Ephydatia muelleri]
MVAAGGDEGETLRQGSKIIPEVFLTGLLATKRILQPYVDEALFTVPSGTAVPKPIKYLFDFLDLQAADMGITDPEVLHTWKTNSLSVISQAYIDARSTSETKCTKDTPSAKLLYVNEVNGYKDRVRQHELQEYILSAHGAVYDELIL